MIEATLRDVLLAQAQCRAEQVYVRCISPSGVARTLTFGGLALEAERFAAGLADLRCAAGRTVVIILPHGPELFAALFGAILGGHVPTIMAVPSGKRDPRHYCSELNSLLQRIQAAALISDDATLAEIEAGAVPLDCPVLRKEGLPESGTPISDVRLVPESPVLLQHSSGSTGLKKGVLLSNRAVLEQIRSYQERLQLTPADQIVSWLPTYHDMGLIACTILPLVLGMTVTTLSPFHWVARPSSLLRAIHEYRPTITWMPNFAYDFMAARVRAGDVVDCRLDSMRAWVNCSEPTIAASHRVFFDRFAPMGVRADTLWTCYAAAETTFAVAQATSSDLPRVERVDRDQLVREHRAVPAAESAQPSSVELLSAGRPLQGTEVRIVSEAGSELADRHIGEIVVRSPSVFDGYYADPDATEKGLRDGWWFSGDLGYRADGHLFVTGRKKDLIILAGKNYYPHDIERAVGEVKAIYPGRVVALGVPDPSIGTQRLIVLAETRDRADVESTEVSLAIRKVVTERVDCTIDHLILVPHMSLLKTSSGKIARRPNLMAYRDRLPDTLQAVAELAT